MIFIPFLSVLPLLFQPILGGLPHAQSHAGLVERSNFPRAISEFGGFALIASTCPSGTSLCDKRACCPDGTTCHKTSRSAQQYSPHCCPSETDCYSTLLNAPVCADSGWLLYNTTKDYLCCQQGEQGLNPAERTLDNLYGSCVPLDGNFAPSVKASLVSAVSYDASSPTSKAGSKQSTRAGVPATTPTNSEADSNSAVQTAPSSPSSSSGSNSSSNSGFSAAAIGGIVGGMGALIIAVVVLGFWMHRRRKKRYERMLEEVTAAAATSKISKVEDRKSPFVTTSITPAQPSIPVQHMEMGELDAQGRPVGRYELHSGR